MVVGLKQLGKTVAFAGENTNDALAIKEADVGFTTYDSSDVAK
jgi:magnesium-transporting ATPase (P-type)